MEGLVTLGEDFRVFGSTITGSIRVIFLLKSSMEGSSCVGLGLRAFGSRALGLGIGRFGSRGCGVSKHKWLFENTPLKLPAT